MECGLCQRDASKRRKLVCVSCVQAALYNPRIDQVHTRLSHEKSHTLVEAVVRPGNDGVLAALPEDADYDAITAGISTQSHRRAKVERDAAELRIEHISEKAKELREQVEGHKRFIAEQKQLHQKKREAVAAQRKELDKRKAQAMEPVHAAIKRANRHLDKIHVKTITSRQFLCDTVGVLCGLQHVKDRKGRSEYFLDGLPIPNLKDLNVLNGRLRGERLGRQSGGQSAAESYELISASLDNICLFLGVCCYYLSIRLPAEVILQDRDFPHAALMQREASYKAGDVRYPGFDSSNTTPSQSRTLPEDGERGKPRIIQLRKPLLQLQKEDHKTYEKFIEGAMLLAYNVAWLCRTQGVTTGTPSFDDVCDIGRNLYQLVNRDVEPSPKRRATPTGNKTEGNVNHDKFGQYSHATAWHSLTGHEGSTMFAPDVWRVSVTTLTDRLKSYLRNEAARSEWHIIDDTEWDDVLEHEQAVMVGGGSILKRPILDRGPAMSIMTVSPQDGVDDESDKASTATTGKAKGSSGWTKLRGRGGDA